MLISRQAQIPPQIPRSRVVNWYKKIVQQLIVLLLEIVIFLRLPINIKFRDNKYF